MLLFSTVLNIKNLTKEDFIQLVIEWNQNSPHPENIISGLSWKRTQQEKYGSDTLWLEIVDYEKSGIVAVRYEKKEEGVIWDTDYIFDYRNKKMSIRLDRSYKEDAVITDGDFSTPQFIFLLISNGYVLDDNGMHVSADPHILTKKNSDILVDLIKGIRKYDLPIIYVSKTKQNRTPIDVGRLSYVLKGVAHVVVQEDASINHQLNKKCSNRNEINGAIGVYYPSQKLGHKRCKYVDGGRPERLMDKIVNYVMQYSNLQILNPMLTWQGVKNCILNDVIERTNEQYNIAISDKTKAQNEVQSVYNEFGDEIDELKARIKELTNRNRLLEEENTRLSAKVTEKKDKAVLFQGNEQDFFDGEISEIILECLRDSIEKGESKTRKAHVIRDIISQNEQAGELEKRRQKIKEIFKGYKAVNGNMKKDLEALGFEVKEEGKHMKLTYFGDSRYMTTIAKTPSDNRSGNNVAANILREMM